jgi:hypothetical protein
VSMVAGSLSLARFLDQEVAWPRQGRHILAQYDEKTVIVYQAYAPAIAEFALQHGYFGGPFSYSRMSWIKPNFLWMMYRSGWGTKPGQERRWRCGLSVRSLRLCSLEQLNRPFPPIAIVHGAIGSMQLRDPQSVYSGTLTMIRRDAHCHAGRCSWGRAIPTCMHLERRS